MQQRSTADVIIIGGGVAGLTAAAFLGRRALVLEQASEPGGRARTQQHGEFFFNLGPHALYRKSAGMPILEELGVSVRGAVPQQSGGYAIMQGEKHAFPAGSVSLLTTSLLPLGAKLEAARVLPMVLKTDCEPLAHVSLREWADEKISHPALREFFMALFRLSTYVNAPDRMSAGAAIGQLQKAVEGGVLYLDGGWQQIVEGLRRAAGQAGAEVETGVKVERVLRDEAGGVRGVRLGDGRVLEAAAVIIAAGPRAALRLVEDGERTALGRWAAEALPSRAACLDVALSSLPRPKATFALGIDRPYYFSVHSATARLAPEGAALIHLAKYLAPEDDRPEAAEAELEWLLDLVQPGWRERVVHRRFLPEMVTVSAIPGFTWGGMKARPGPAVPEVAGLFVAGDWVGPHGQLVDASLASARQAAALVAARLEAGAEQERVA